MNEELEKAFYRIEETNSETMFLYAPCIGHIDGAHKC